MAGSGRLAAPLLALLVLILPWGARGAQHCPLGYYAHRVLANGAVAIECTVCPAGRYGSAISVDARCSGACVAGKYSSTGAAACTACSPGKHQPLPGKEMCLFCDRGRHAGAGALTCVHCTPGHHAHARGAAACAKCVGGRYSVDGAGCLACPSGRFGATTGSSSPQCDGACPAGKHASSAASTHCSECGGGRFAPRDGSTQCAACPVGKFSRVEHSRFAMTVSGPRMCHRCAGGRFGANAAAQECEDCKSGSYAPAGSASCQLCPAGRIGGAADAPPPSSAACAGPCPSGHRCARGTTAAAAASADDFMTACAPGKFARIGSSACGSCPAGRFAAKRAASSCTTCHAGQYQPHSTSTRCRRCAFGKSSFQFGAGAGPTSCFVCPHGAVNLKDGSSPCRTTAPTSAPTAAPTPMARDPTPPPTPRPPICASLRLRGQHAGELMSGCMGAYHRCLKPACLTYVNKAGLRPVYTMHNVQDYSCTDGHGTAYLFYAASYGMWVVGPHLGAPPFFLVAKSSAFAPDHVAADVRWTANQNAADGAGVYSPMAAVRLVCPAPTPYPTPPPTPPPTPKPTPTPTTAAVEVTAWLSGKAVAANFGEDNRRQFKVALAVAAGLPMTDVVVDFWKQPSSARDRSTVVTVDFKLLMPLAETAAIARLVAAPSFTPFLASKLRTYGLPLPRGAAAAAAALRLSAPVVLQHLNAKAMHQKNELPPPPPRSATVQPRTEAPTRAAAAPAAGAAAAAVTTVATPTAQPPPPPPPPLQQQPSSSASLSAFGAQARPLTDEQRELAKLEHLKGQVVLAGLGFVMVIAVCSALFFFRVVCGCCGDDKARRRAGYGDIGGGGGGGARGGVSSVEDGMSLEMSSVPMRSAPERAQVRVAGGGQTFDTRQSKGPPPVLLPSQQQQQFYQQQPPQLSQPEQLQQAQQIQQQVQQRLAQQREAQQQAQRAKQAQAQVQLQQSLVPAPMSSIASADAFGGSGGGAGGGSGAGGGDGNSGSCYEVVLDNTQQLGFGLAASGWVIRIEAGGQAARAMVRIGDTLERVNGRAVHGVAPPHWQPLAGGTLVLIMKKGPAWGSGGGSAASLFSAGSGSTAGGASSAVMQRLYPASASGADGSAPAAAPSGGATFNI